MTLKNSLRALFWALFLGCAVWQPNFAMAEECTEERIKEIEEDFDKNAKDSIDATVQALEKYNNLVQQFESCGGKVKVGSPSTWTYEAQMAANEVDAGLGAKLINPENNKYTGVVWSTASPPKCKSIAQQASAQLDAYNKAKTTTSSFLAVVRGKKEARACLCSQDNENTECLSYNEESTQPSETKDGCYTFSEYMAGMASCPLCSVFEVILNTDARVAHVAWNTIAEPLKDVVTIFFGVILAIETLKAVGALAGSSISSYLKTVLIQGLKVAIVLILLSNSTYIYGYFISPVIKGGLEMGEVFLQMGAENSGGCQMNGTEGNFGEVAGTELDSEILSNILSTVRCFNNSSVIMPSVGRALMCHGWNAEWLPDLSMSFSGLVIYIFGLMIWLAITFYLIDCTVQLGMVCALIPLFIACWPFKMTTRYTTTGVKMILNTFFNFVLMGVVVLVGLEIVSFALSGGDPESDMTKYISILNLGDPKLDDLKKMGELDGEGVLILIICAIMAMKMIAIANGAANKFSAGSGSGIGAKMGGTAMSAIHKTVAEPVKQANPFSRGTFANNMVHTIANETQAGRTLRDAGNTVGRVVSKPFKAMNKFATQTAPAAIGRGVGLGRFQERGTQGGGNKAPKQLDDRAQDALENATASGSTSQDEFNRQSESLRETLSNPNHNQEVVEALNNKDGAQVMAELQQDPKDNAAMDQLQNKDKEEKHVNLGNGGASRPNVTPSASAEQNTPNDNSTPSTENSNPTSDTGGQQTYEQAIDDFKNTSAGRQQEQHQSEIQRDRANLEQQTNDKKSKVIHDSVRQFAKERDAGTLTPEREQEIRNNQKEQLQQIDAEHNAASQQIDQKEDAYQQQDQQAEDQYMKEHLSAEDYQAYQGINETTQALKEMERKRKYGK